MGIKCMCGYEKERGQCTTIRLTSAEQKDLKVLGQEAPSEIHYCAPCLRVLQDPEQGPKFMRGVREQTLLASGVPKRRATELADQFYTELLTRTKAHGTKS